MVAESPDLDDSDATGSEPGRSRTRARSRTHRTLAAIGAFIALVAIDATGGVAWDHFHPATPTGPVANVTDALGGGSASFHDDRADTPAMRDVPWRNAYFAEMRQIRYEYWPFLLNRPLPFDGRYFNLDGWSRQTWQPPASDEELPTVWFLGGSALWGEGQRDLHTIPSEVARLAAADGLAIHAVNYGQSGWVLHQETTLFSQLLADTSLARPDLVAFYDGANEVSVQQQMPEAVQRDPISPMPSHFGVDRALATISDTPTTVAPASPSPSDLLAEYEQRSMLLRGARAVRRAVTGDPADARGAGGATATERAAAVYTMDRATARQTATGAGITPFFFWQPVGLAVPGYPEAAHEVGEPTVDLTGVLSGREEEVFMDLVHTNEAGARVVAEQVYLALKPAIAAWHRAHP